MKVAVITLVVDDAEGIHEQKILQAKTYTSLKKAVEVELPRLIRDYHEVSDFLEEEDDQYIADVVEDLMDGDDSEIYAPSCYQGSGFIQVRYF